MIPITVQGIQFYRVNNDTNGNPRYVTHFLNLVGDLEGKTLDLLKKAKKRANSLGGAKYRGKDFGGSFVFQSYNLDDLASSINKIAK